MHDRQPTPGQEGRMLITPENGSAPFYAKVEMADNPLHEGTALNKANLLTDDTAALFGLDNTAVPDDVLAFLGKYNKHWWKRRINKVTAQLGEVENATLSAATSARDTDSVTYSDGITIDTATGRVSLSKPTTKITCSYDKYTNANVLAGKYFINYQGELYYAEPTARAVKSIESAYYYYSEIPAAVVTATQELGEWEELVSSDRSAYPDSGISDGFEWVYLGVPFQNAVTAPKVSYGSYIGTGTNSASTPVTLTFDFSPKFILIAPDSYMAYGDSNVHSEKYYVQIWMPGITKTLFYEYNGNSTRYMSVSGNTFSFYEIISGNGGNIGTLNASGKAYYYIAFGF